MKSTVFLEAQTPSYIFSVDDLIRRIGLIRNCLNSRIRIVYAVKANPFLVRPLIPHVDAFEICSPGEEHICRNLGVPAEQMVLSGVNKDEDNFRDIIEHCGSGAVCTAESVHQAELLNKIAVSHGLTLRVLLRLSSGNQFGMDEETIRALLRKCGQFPGLLFAGLQLYSGTQKKLPRILRETEALDKLMGCLREEAGSAVPEGFMEELEYGPGLPVSYFTDRPPALITSSPQEPAKTFDASASDAADIEVLTALGSALDKMRHCRTITLEIGRFLAAPCGFYLTKIVDCKTTAGAGYCITDGGIHQMNYFGQMMGMKQPHILHLRRLCKNSETDEGTFTDTAAARTEGRGAPARPSHWTICGSLCTTADVMVRDLPLSNPQINDILAFERAGAYSVTEGISLFLSRDLPVVYLSRQGELSCIRKRLFTEVWNS